VVQLTCHPGEGRDPIRIGIQQERHGRGIVIPAKAGIQWLGVSKLALTAETKSTSLILVW